MNNAYFVDFKKDQEPPEVFHGAADGFPDGGIPGGTLPSGFDPFASVEGGDLPF